MTQTLKAQDDILLVRRIVDTARQEVELAVMFHESWRPAAYDIELHARIGTSFAAHTFQIIRLSLRRELILALNRIWDTNKKAVRMSLIAEHMRDKEFFSALVQYRSERIGLRFSDAMREALAPKRNQVRELISKYSEGGTAFEVLKRLRDLRNQQLAHRGLLRSPDEPADVNTQIQRDEKDGPHTWVTDDEIEAFYQDTLEIMRLLLSLVQGMSFDLAEATNVYKHHAKYFWAAARGERTEGHPFFRLPSSGEGD